jgi:hypothetical protein
VNRYVPSPTVVKLGALEAAKICQRKIAVEVDELNQVLTFLKDSEAKPFSPSSRLGLMLIQRQLGEVYGELTKWIEDEEKD